MLPTDIVAFKQPTIMIIDGDASAGTKIYNVNDIVETDLCIVAAVGIDSHNSVDLLKYMVNKTEDVDKDCLKLYYALESIKFKQNICGGNKYRVTNTSLSYNILNINRKNMHTIRFKTKPP